MLLMNFILDQRIFLLTKDKIVSRIIPVCKTDFVYNMEQEAMNHIEFDETLPLLSDEEFYRVIDELYESPCDCSFSDIIGSHDSRMRSFIFFFLLLLFLFRLYYSAIR